MSALERLSRGDAGWPSLEIWRIDLDGWPHRGEPSITLSDAERERAARYVFERDRRRYLAAHEGLRQLLAFRTGLPPSALRFDVGPFGKPRLDEVPECSFNLSHTDGVALVALATGAEIGIDVESMRYVHDVAGLAADTFSAEEQDDLRSLPEQGRSAAFLRGWTRKEACLKAVGSGLSIAPASISVGIREDPRTVAISSAGHVARVRVHCVPLGSALVGAIAQVL